MNRWNDSKITPEQARLLNEFAARFSRPHTPVQPGLLETWLGVSSNEIQGLVQTWLARKDALEGRLLDWAESRPLDAALEFVAGASLAFYQAEKHANPKIRNFIDAYYYIATCASVGYADIFAVTPTGRSIAALVMVVGPALTSRSLDRPARPARSS